MVTRPARWDSKTCQPIQYFQLWSSLKMSMCGPVWVKLIGFIFGLVLFEALQRMHTRMHILWSSNQSLSSNSISVEPISWIKWGSEDGDEFRWDIRASSPAGRNTKIVSQPGFAFPPRPSFSYFAARMACSLLMMTNRELSLITSLYDFDSWLYSWLLFFSTL